MIKQIKSFTKGETDKENTMSCPANVACILQYINITENPKSNKLTTNSAFMVGHQFSTNSVYNTSIYW